jgi:hypothetical protein
MTDTDDQKREAREARRTRRAEKAAQWKITKAEIEAQHNIPRKHCAEIKISGAIMTGVIIDDYPSPRSADLYVRGDTLFVDFHGMKPHWLRFSKEAALEFANALISAVDAIPADARPCPPDYKLW